MVPEWLAQTLMLVPPSKRALRSGGLVGADDEGRVEIYELWVAGHGREDAEAHASGNRKNLIVTAGHLSLELGSERFELARATPSSLLPTYRTPT